ncbi:hypothetical protein BCR43DRAFT_445732 [Syncephalastrum racemosum]|uniref:Uncharacterized protein n=1 Tax=Syncephalastrum racemosum TaxID=13706 RepID=A0A1X2H249_SYNRA|nr:hypothetical protein BCR43DRAFT_445732 [Syncephalastrum racemosum]
MALLPHKRLVYKDVWPAIFPGSEGPKSVIGTQVFNIWLASRMRLDGLRLQARR